MERGKALLRLQYFYIHEEPSERDYTGKDKKPQTAHEHPGGYRDSLIPLSHQGKIHFSDPIIYEKNQKIFIKSKIKFDVDDQEQLYRRFLIPRQNRIDLNKVYFEVEYNIDDGNYFLSSINFNENKNNQLIFHKINNIQQLNNLISKEFKKVSLE